MGDRVKAEADAQKKAETQETGQKAGELLLAVLEELRASRKESEALRQLLETVIARLARQEASEKNVAEEENEAEQEGSARHSAYRTLNRASEPIAIQLVAATRTVGKREQG